MAASEYVKQRLEALRAKPRGKVRGLRLLRRVPEALEGALPTRGPFVGCRKKVYCHCTEDSEPHFHWCQRTAAAGEYCRQHRRDDRDSNGASSPESDAAETSPFK